MWLLTRINTRWIRSASACLGGEANDLKANEIKGIGIDSVATGIKNSIKRNGISSDTVNLVIGETKRNGVDTVKGSHAGE
jgi:hypothetical protein